ncbi:Acetolactate synthase catalytic subunit [Durusdinium trenchii]|uniref:Acetolactate synthase n=1 Tax=Durusdinium trenchii TaxID=1381693 RepID=A0ABP0M4R7_9DINO
MEVLCSLRWQTKPMKAIRALCGHGQVTRSMLKLRSANRCHVYALYGRSWGRQSFSSQVAALRELTGGEVIFNMLIEHGVDTVFGYSGGAVLPLIDAFHGKNIKWITSAHEQCSGHSAAAYAKSTGKFGVAIVTSGPGLTNMVTPMQDALTDGVPMVVFSGQVPTGAMGTDAFQECPATEITRSCTKWNYVCLDFNQLPWAVNEAFRIAKSGRPGPCHIDLPKDIVSMSAKVPEAIFKKASVSSADAPPMLDMTAVQKAADLINKSKRPILYVGQGASHCPEIVSQIAHKANIPVTTTCHGMGIFDEQDPLSMHMLGMHGAAYANFAIQNADCIIAVGSRFDDRTTGIVAKYAPKARAAEKDGSGGIIHINIDKSTFGKVLQPTVALWADTEHALEALEPLVSTNTREEWLKQCQAWKKEHKFNYVKAPGGRLKTQQVIEAVNTHLEQKPPTKEVFVATGVGNHQMMSCQFIRWKKPRTFITSGSLGVMGAGLPFAIGTQVANPDALTILIDGDGSFGMTNMDLQTVKRYKLPIKIAIMNDDRQQMVWIWQRLFFEGRYISVTNDNPDFVALAQAYGIKAVHCDNEADLPKVIEEWLTSDGPMLVDFKVVPDICLPMVAPGKALDEMILLQDRDAVLGTEEELGSMKFEGLAPS